MEEQRVVDEQRPGRPRTESTDRSDERVQLTRADRRVTVEEKVTKLESGTILCIALSTRACN